MTGAASGMGTAHATALAEAGWDVCLADVQDTEAVAGPLRERGLACSEHRLDVTDEAGWQALLDELLEQGRPPTGLVNNAGVSHRHGFSGTSLQDWHRVVGINLTGAFLGIRTLAPVMAEGGGGAIVNVSSIAGTLGYFSPSYGASKWGLVGLSKSAAGEWAASGVRVNAVLPGLVDTPLLDGADQFVASSLRSVPMQRVAAPSEVASVVRFLLSEDAAYVTGAELLIDGAMTAAGMYKRIREEL